MFLDFAYKHVCNLIFKVYFIILYYYSILIQSIVSYIRVPCSTARTDLFRLYINFHLLFHTLVWGAVDGSVSIRRYECSLIWRSNFANRAIAEHETIGAFPG